MHLEYICINNIHEFRIAKIEQIIFTEIIVMRCLLLNCESENGSRKSHAFRQNYQAQLSFVAFETILHMYT